ncbi:MAG: BrnT family toxin [Bacteroidetes bacterium]|nr:BrnT family toxin [Bacteroidota bacterium]MBU2586061.1 BrnT family toxin [Bacteroidota bacterium]
MIKIFEKCEGFQWDEGNSEKNRIKHNVFKSECEQVFFNKPIIVSDSKKNYEKEKRWYLLGKTDLDRRLFVVFTIRKNMIRVISARDMSKKERERYNEEI